MGDMWVFKKQKFKHIQMYNVGTWWGLETFPELFTDLHDGSHISLNYWVSLTLKKHFLFTFLFITCKTIPMKIRIIPVPCAFNPPKKLFLM